VLTIEASTIKDNAAETASVNCHEVDATAQGGGIWFGGTLTITGSTITSNAAQGGGHAGFGASRAHGGGIYQRRDSTLTLESSTISDNVVQVDPQEMGMEGGSSYGGGHYVDSSPGWGTRASFRNCTLSGNRARREVGTDELVAQGGGLWIEITAEVELSFCTITNNEAYDQGGGLYSHMTLDDSGPIVRNTIIGGNNASTGNDIYQTIQSRGWNLIQDTSGGTLDTTGGDNTAEGNITGVNPRLGPLQDNGGATWTHTLLGGANPSLAIDAGSSTDIDGNSVSVDQRGFSRPQPGGGAHDMGAYERGVADLSITKTVAPAEARPGGTITYTLVLSNQGYERATGVIVSDPIPPELASATVVSATIALTDTGATPAYVWQVADILPGHTETITLTAVLKDGLAAGHVFTNTATVTTTEIDAGVDDNESASPVLVLEREPVAVYLPLVLR
jgi:uncharacterized repeat protein (TIGR01451 family)